MNKLQVSLFTVFSIFFLIGQIDCASKCFKCSGIGCSDNTTTIETCSVNTSFCSRITTTVAGFSIVVKGCATSCKDQDTYLIGPTSITYSCCTTDLCNTFQASSGLTAFDLNFKNQLLGLCLIMMSILHSI